MLQLLGYHTKDGPTVLLHEVSTLLRWLSNLVLCSTRVSAIFLVPHTESGGEDAGIQTELSGSPCGAWEVHKQREWIPLCSPSKAPISQH